MVVVTWDWKKDHTKDQCYYWLICYLAELRQVVVADARTLLDPMSETGKMVWTGNYVYSCH